MLTRFSIEIMPRRGITKIEFFKTLFLIIAIQKNYLKKVPNPLTNRRCMLFLIQDSLGVRNAVLQKDKTHRITKGSRNSEPKYPLYYQQPLRAVSTRNKVRTDG